MPFLLALAAAILLWAWWTGRLRRFTLEDGIAAAIFLLGLRLAPTGRLVIGLGLIAAAAAWALMRRRAGRGEALTSAEARLLLGVSEGAALEEIRAAHRRLIKTAHPDAGGSELATRRLNAARDRLAAELNRNRREES
ncbi:MAG: J domain-containing protein [Sphingomonadaceae bacterium]